MDEQIMSWATSRPEVSKTDYPKFKMLHSLMVYSALLYCFVGLAPWWQM